MSAVESTENTSENREGLDELCRPFLEALPISGVSVTVISASGARASLCSSDPVSARIDELQFELGEGPQRAAATTGEIITISDIQSHHHNDWPVLGSALRELPVRAIFSVPMRMGAVTVGVATLHCFKPGDLDEDERAMALAIASAIAVTAVQRAMIAASSDRTNETEAKPALRREVHQATGIMVVQLGTTATIAYSRLQAYAFANGLTVQEVARDVVTGALTFDESTT